MKHTPWTPVLEKQEDHSKYDPQVVLDYIHDAYGDATFTLDDVPLGCSCGQEALEKLGYEYEEEDGYFPPDPRLPAPKFSIGSLVVTKRGSVGVVVANEGSEYALGDVLGYKTPPRYAGYSEKELRAFPK